MDGEYGAWLCGCGVEWPIDRGTEALSCPRCGSGTLISVRMYTGPFAIPDEAEAEQAEAEAITAQMRGQALAWEIRRMVVATSWGNMLSPVNPTGPQRLAMHRFRMWIDAYLFEHRN